MSELQKLVKNEGLSELQKQKFRRDGYLIVRNMATVDLRQRMIEAVETSLRPALGPLEYEADLSYPGAPENKSAAGGFTPRRLLNAYARDAVFREWANDAAVVSVVKQLLGTEQLMLTQNHHNCIMTKMPEYSSQTGWHQDIRYWSFDRPQLVNVWLALGDEYTEKGGMKFIPGSHKLELDRGRFDADLFLRHDLAENKILIDSAVDAELKAGDVLFFHCRTFHVAGANQTNEPKYSLVFSYHAADNKPIPGTRSARLDSVMLDQGSSTIV
jgi:phytanoyl-CoA hydroxylase